MVSMSDFMSGNPAVDEARKKLLSQIVKSGLDTSPSSSSSTNSSSAVSSSKSSSSGSSNKSSGGVASSTTLRDYLSQHGLTPSVDDANRMVTIGGNTYSFGAIPGTRYDTSTGLHYVTDPDALNTAVGIGGKSPTNQQQNQPYIVVQQESQYDPMELINELKRAQREARIAALDKAKTAALGALDTEKANVAPIYYDKRNQAAAQSDIGAMNFAQYMAARGIKGAAGAMPEIYRQAGLQGQIGALDLQEAANLAAIERQRSLIEQGYASETHGRFLCSL